MALSVASNLVMGTALFILSPVIPQIYNTSAHVREMAMKMIWVVAAAMPLYSIAHCCYFTLRSGGRTIITFIFDSGYTWGICVPVAFLLANMTSMPIVPLYLVVQGLEIIKVMIGITLVKRGVWVRNIIEHASAEGEAC